MKIFTWAILTVALILPAPAEAGPCQVILDKYSISQIGGNTPLTLDAVLREIRRSSPETRAAGLETLARAADADQAGKRVNPVLSVEIEEFAGSGPLNGFNAAETTLAFEHTLRLGGKRQRAEDGARALTELASAECAVILRESELQGAISFYGYLHALEDATLLENAGETTKKLEQSVRKRVAAGAAPPPELTRAESAAATARGLAVSARGEAERRRYELASLWGESDPVFTSAISQNSVSGPPYSANTLTHPALKRAAASHDALRAAIEIERAAAIPDITVSAGFRRFEETGDGAIVAGIAVPLPLFDRNRDAVRASEIRAQAGRFNQNTVEARLRARQRGAVAAVESARQHLEILETTALPSARSAYESSVEGYEAGKFDLTTTFDARNALTEAQRSVLNAKYKLRVETALLKSLVGDAPFFGE
jgi:cobalt-zinc-cadmium efflux system outer membrane protein